MLEALSLIHIKMASSSKKSKKSNNISKVDRISKLPDPLLVKIISLLPTKSAVQTSLLSKRWRPISLSLTNLDFDDSPRHKNCPIKFTNFVEKLLIHRPNDLNIEKFRLRCGRDYYFNRFDEWIGNAIGRDPREIRLSFWFREPYKVIPEIFLCTSLQVLKLSCGMLVDVPEDVRFSSLRVLKCERVRLSSCESVGRLLVNCPVLERLSIKMCKWLSGSRLSICGAPLKKLTFSDTLADVDEVFLPDDDVIVPEVFIATPALETLYIGTFAADNILIEENLQFLRKAYFDLQQRVQGVLPSGVFGDCVFGLLKKINHVKSFSLHYRTVEVLNRAYRCDFKTVHNGFPPFHNLTELELSVEAYCEEILLCDFLYNSPNLQSLQFPQGLLDPLSGETWRFNWIWVRSKRVPECISTHLKTVYIREFHGTTDELSLVGYLLYNGSVLENVTIDTLVLQDDAEVDDAEDDDAEVDDAEVEVREELLQYPRKSTTCKLNLYF